MTTTQREREDDKPLGDSGTGASGGGSIGNLPGGAATGGDVRQGVRRPDAKGNTANREVNSESHQDDPNRREEEHPGKTGDDNGEPEAHTQTASEAALPSTQDKNPRPK